jgi:hypothetical protein
MGVRMSAGPQRRSLRVAQVSVQAESERDLHVPQRRIWPRGMVGGGGTGDRPGSPRSLPTAARSRCLQRPVRRCHSLHRRSSESRQANKEQVVSPYAYAAVYKSDSEFLGQFIRRKGGINECAARFSRYSGEVIDPEPAVERWLGWQPARRSDGAAAAKLATHLSDAYFSTWPKQIRAAPVADLDWGHERTGSLEGRPDALRDALAADRADL